MTARQSDAGFDMAAADELQKFQQETAAMTFCFLVLPVKLHMHQMTLHSFRSIPIRERQTFLLEYLVNGFAYLLTTKMKHALRHRKVREIYL